MGRSRGGLTTKIHALVDGRGLPVGLHLSEGQASDCRKAIRARIESNGGFANIPAKRNRRKGFAFSAFLYRADSDDPGRLFRSDPGHYSEVKPDGPSQIVGR